MDPARPATARNGWPEAGLRVSDADRAAVADRLASHFSEGRLDQAEFDQRLDRAMRATTRADLVGLLSDLPEGMAAPDDDPHRPRGQRRRERELMKVRLERERLLLRHERREHRRLQREQHWQSMRQLPEIIAVVVIILGAAALVRQVYSIWLVFAVLAFLWLRHSQRNRGG